MAQPSTLARVVVSQNGPYLVSGGVPLERQSIVADGAGDALQWQPGAAIPAADRYALCRCGHSGRKPFCDGTHKKIGFDGTETASRAPYHEQAQLFEGPAAALTDAPALCAHAGFCDAHGSVWKQVEQGAAPEARASFTAQVNLCPSGRLVAWERGRAEALEAALPVSIAVTQAPSQGVSGPLWLRGGIALIAADGFAYEVRNRATLCRCGASKNKPFCDGSHYAVGFRDWS